MEPLVGVVEVVAAGGEAELVLLVVGFEQVGEDCAGFPECDVCVWVADGGEAAVGVVDGVGWVFDAVVGDVDYLVGEVEFAEEEGYFEWVGAGDVAVDGDWFDVGWHFGLLLLLMILMFGKTRERFALILDCLLGLLAMVLSSILFIWVSRLVFIPEHLH